MKIERANAKINLYLDVVGRRENGYHEIVSLMQTVSLCDIVTVSYLPAEQTVIRLDASGNDSMPTDNRTLAWRAAEKFLAAASRRGEVRITIEKHIPMAAGLAGGSSDAAAVLRALNSLCGSPLSTDELCRVGASLGADIPFCILGGGAMVKGIGERLEAIPTMPQCHLVVSCMGEGVSTPWAYGRLDEKYGFFANAVQNDTPAREILDLMARDGVLAAAPKFFNLFEDVVPSVQPYVDQLKSIMNQNGAVRSMMSGSGPSVFGVFATAADASTACAALHALGAPAFVCHPTKSYL